MKAPCHAPIPIKGTTNQICSILRTSSLLRTAMIPTLFQASQSQAARDLLVDYIKGSPWSAKMQTLILTEIHEPSATGEGRYQPIWGAIIQMFFRSPDFITQSHQYGSSGPNKEVILFELVAILTLPHLRRYRLILASDSLWMILNADSGCNY